jgi:hypothetical protein
MQTPMTYVALHTTARHEHPILFTGPMVRAILDGRKTQTRRVVKPQPEPSWLLGCQIQDDPGFAVRVGPDVPDIPSDGVRSPYGVPGDRLWVRETWCPLDYPEHAADPAKPRDTMIHGKRNGIAYRANCGPDSERCRIELGYKWRPSIHMPRWASRITLEITRVRVERVQEISTPDAIAEGMANDGGGEYAIDGMSVAQVRFMDLWEKLNAKRGFGWDVNPWVWVIEFRTVP